MGYKSKKKKQLLILIRIIIFSVIILGVIVGIAINRTRLGNEDLDENIENVAKDNEDEEEDKDDGIIKVVIDDPQGENNEQEHENDEHGHDEKDNNIIKTMPNYYIKVNIRANVVTIYKKDSVGKYTIPYKAMICSTGDATPTSGIYKISDKYTWRLLQGNVYGQYAVRITGHILFHSVPYSKKAKDTLEWWEYDKLGTSASLGCIRLTVQDAKWIYDNCEKGTEVEFYSDSNPGPLGKPTAKKISNYSDNAKKWDPTDPDTKNPWKTGKVQEPPMTTETVAPETVAPETVIPETVVPETTDKPNVPEVTAPEISGNKNTVVEDNNLSTEGVIIPNTNNEITENDKINNV